MRATALLRRGGSDSTQEQFTQPFIIMQQHHATVQQMADVFDVVIVGGGPTGLACALEAQKRGMSYLVVEQGGITDAIRRFPVNMTFFSTPELLELDGIPFTTTNVRPSRREALQYYRKVVESRRLNIRLHTRVERIQRNENRSEKDRAKDSEADSHAHPEQARFFVHTAAQVFAARRVIIATGYFDVTNRLGVVGEDLPHVSHYYDEPYRYAMSSVVLVGGRNSAVEAALELWRHGARVTMVHRGEGIGQSVKYWVKPDIENRLKNGEITAYFSSIVREIRVGELVIEHLHTHECRTIQADFVFPLIGYRPDENLLRSAGVEVHERTLVPYYHPETFETNVQGLYIAGSVACGCETWTIFIENGRMHAKLIFDHICSNKNFVGFEHL